MVSKSIIFLLKSFLGNFYRHLAIFSGHTGANLRYHSIDKSSTIIRDAARMEVNEAVEAEAQIIEK